MLTLIQSELVAIFVAGLAAFILGFIWYHPKTFAPRWMAEQPHRKAPDDYQKTMMQGMIASLIDAFILATLIFLLFVAYGNGGVILLAAGIIAGTFAANSFKGGTLALWIIDGSFVISQLILIWIILGLFA